MSYGGYTNSTEPGMILLWDIRNTPNLTTCVAHFGTKETCKALKKRKDLPTYEQVRAKNLKGEQYKL